MLNYITGIIKEIGSNYVVIENNGIGYQVYVGNPYVYRENLEYTIYLYNYIREDEYTLYGFKKREEKNLFLNQRVGCFRMLRDLDLKWLYLWYLLVILMM